MEFMNLLKLMNENKHNIEVRLSDNEILIIIKKEQGKIGLYEYIKLWIEGGQKNG